MATPTIDPRRTSTTPQVITYTNLPAIEHEDSASRASWGFSKARSLETEVYKL